MLPKSSRYSREKGQHLQKVWSNRCREADRGRQRSSVRRRIRQEFVACTNERRVANWLNRLLCERFWNTAPRTSERPSGLSVAPARGFLNPARCRWPGRYASIDEAPGNRFLGSRTRATTSRDTEKMGEPGDRFRAISKNNRETRPRSITTP